jgi:hypothetical protein
MKRQLPIGFLLLCCALSFNTYAQQPTQKNTVAPGNLQFATLPAKSICNRAELEKTLSLAKLDHVSLQLTDNLHISGQVVEKIQSSPGIQTINIRLSNSGNALLNITIIDQPGNTSRITGRIIHPKNSEAIVIAEENGRYYVTKHKMEFFMVE